MSTSLFDVVSKQRLPFSRVTFFRSLRFGLAVGSASLAAIVLWQNYTQIRSRQAFVNAQIVDVRIPIDGDLTLKPLQSGQWLNANEVIGQVKNSRVPTLELKRQDLKSELQLLQQQLSTLNQQIGDRQQDLDHYLQEAEAEKSLGVETARQQVRETEGQLKQVRFEAQYDAADAKRNGALVKEGAIAAAVAERAMAKANQTNSAVETAQARLSQTQEQLNAAELGLQVGGSRTLSYSEIRLRELQREIRELQQKAADLQVQLKAKTRELAAVEQQLKLNQLVEIKPPINGPVWSMESKPQEFVTAGSPILKVLNCQSHWVDAYVSEQEVAKLYPGMPAEVRLEGLDKQVLQGKVESIRGGLGRSKLGEDAAIPPPESALSQIAVRVSVQWSSQPPAQEFCYVGRTAEVIFPKGFAAAASK